MADKLITQLNSVATLADDDLLIASDTSASETKKVTFQSLKNSIAAGGTLTDIVQDTTPQLGANLDVNGQTITSASNGNVDIDPDGTGDILLGNNTQIDGGTDYLLWNAPYTDESALPSASTYHGMFAHVHATGHAYFAHAGQWVQLALDADIPTDTNTTYSVGDGGLTENNFTNTLKSKLDSINENYLTSLTPGTAQASKVLVLNNNLDIGNINNLTITEIGRAHV